MLEVLYPLNALLMLALPVVAVVLARRRLGVATRVLGFGALTFVLSQVVHLPLNYGVAAAIGAGVLPRPPAAWDVWLLPLALGLSAGVCEEIARYVGYRTALKDVRSWVGGVGYGVGHGGIEALLVALIAVSQTINLFVLRSIDLESALPPEQVEQVRQHLEAAWSASPAFAFVGLFERICAMVAHVGMSVLVLQAVRRHVGWLFASIGAHTLLNAGAVFLAQRYGVLATEGWILLGAVALGAAAWALRDRGPVAT